jgi:uncharacterized protein (DUF302 family)
MPAETLTQTSYGFGHVVQGSFDDVLTRTREALKSEGFGVITEIDVKATMKDKLGLEESAYTILGACNPALAHRALEAERELGLLLPCNVIVYETEDGTRVSAMDPGLMSQLVDNPVLTEVAGEVRARLVRVLENL